MLEEIEPAMVISYEIFNSKTGEKIFKAKSTQIAVLAGTQKSVYIAPKKLVEIFEESKSEKA